MSPALCLCIGEGIAGSRSGLRGKGDRVEPQTVLLHKKSKVFAIRSDRKCANPKGIMQTAWGVARTGVRVNGKGWPL